MSSLLERARVALAGHYEVERELGRGGMGAVLLARDVELDRLVAIKVLPPDLAAHADLRERFLRETRTAAGFNHPNIVSVHAVEEVDGLLCLVMEYVDGDTLTQRVRRGGPMSPAEAVRLLEETGWALAYAHSRGVVHRDVKPDNILLERATGRALITDFGIARSSSAADGLTRVGEVIGTPQFMSPEQAAGEELDGRSDLYSLGVVGFFALTAKLPFQAPTAQALLGMHLTQAPPSVTSLRPDLPAALASVIDRCLAKDPDDRFPGGEALVSAVEELSIAKPVVAPAVRLFHQQANQALRLTLVLVLIGAGVVPRWTTGDQLIFWAFILAGIWGLIQTLYHRARFLLRQGFSFEDVRAGFQTIADEGGAARELLRNSDADIARHRRRLQVATVTGGLGVLMALASMLFLRQPTPEGLMSVTSLGLVTVIIAAIMISQAIISFLTDPMRPKRFEQLSGRIWRGPAGRGLFRLAGRGMTDHAAAGPRSSTDTAASLTAASGPSAMLDSLPTGTRKRLAGVRRRVDELERALAAMTRRERHLSAALAEANTTTGGDPLLLADQRAGVITELEEARKALLVEQRELIQHLEEIRLQVLRVKGGVGAIRDIHQAVQRH